MSYVENGVLSADYTRRLEPTLTLLQTRLQNGDYGTAYGPLKPTAVVVSVDPSLGSVHLIVIQPQIGRLLSMVLLPFPSCCALSLFHGFTYHSGVFTSEDVAAVMDVFLAEFQSSHNRRLQVMMVEARDGWHRDRQTPEPKLFQEIPMLGHEEMRKRIAYPHVFDYFHSRASVKTQLMWNANTGNIIHSMEVIFGKPTTKEVS